MTDDEILAVLGRRLVSASGAGSLKQGEGMGMISDAKKQLEFNEILGAVMQKIRAMDWWSRCVKNGKVENRIEHSDRLLSMFDELDSAVQRLREHITAEK